MKTVRARIMTGLALAVAAALLVGSVGCSNAETVTEKAAETAIETQTGEEASVDVDGDTAEVKVGDVTTTVGEGIPDSWPSDVPLPDDFKLGNSAAVTVMGATQTTVVGDTGASASDLVEFYKVSLTGWDNPRSNEWEDQSGHAVTSNSFTKDDRVLTVTITDHETHRELHLNYNEPVDE